MAKIAAEFERAVARRAEQAGPGHASARLLATGPGWRVLDVVCNYGPQDRPFEEQHSRASIAMIAAGSFQYRGEGGCALMTPGSLLLGNPGQHFVCSHDHGAGDRCIAFQYERDFFERLAYDAGMAVAQFPTLKVPPSKEMSPLVSSACAGLVGCDVSWEELSLQLAARTLRLCGRQSRSAPAPAPSSIARVSRAVRYVERNPGSVLALADLAQQAKLSPYHFLRTFQQTTGMTPHQYVLRVRLREAAMRLKAGSAKILDIALDTGFGDVSNFNRAFRAEFGTAPRAYRQSSATA